MRYDAVVFDLDGTLVDSAPDMARAINGVLATRGRRALSLAEVISFIGSGARILVQRSLRATGGIEGEDDALAEFLRRYETGVDHETAVYTGVMEMLGALRAAGLPMALCTNKPEAPARDLSARLGLGGFFPVIVGGDTLPVLKPDPAPLHHAITGLSADPARTLYVGDSETDYKTARAAQVDFAFVEGGYQSRPIPDFAPTHRLARPALVGDLVLSGVVTR
ncbi:putative phosphoglycolate phosphatase [Dinoroseobacter shibae DFL 12 = DSM 16493]|jgi:phosphoglycolate phosphatase|uniref:Phosphoglycolate phosphatase n=1 Tax=Dinoroseobacter shibae (strain DSM 16493 / NCIMB 14021 / DFL 12) TaxID=398580 RepID=A8LIZ8_DINSH|nr:MULTISPECIES: phosphoglycolate phosphatase [Dinoroseobacter]ABV94493.1 putative phosphoglycolate phosphatase [Dinoroseobacter shibae DFL 12 = DSM 16493]MDD9717068.1 phosphoglycolate phosphatase [Dinoroseobacter sp. PD6]URF45920.1 phosphoglycolate phosphatase [Dinoroseobacter shibae]URF50226.1 phosphoglycolate phosphatase [Dinoroseobacter shibae]